jgi:hypothetical protein
MCAPTLRNDTEQARGVSGCIACLSLLVYPSKNYAGKYIMAESIENTKEEQTGKQSLLSILIANYREARQEGTKLAHSVFTDVTFAVTLLAGIIGGGVIADEPKLLLLIPFIIGGFAVYALQKLRVNNLITSYMIYLEQAVNAEYGKPVLIWNSVFIRNNVSAGRQSKWGHAILVFAAILVTGVYSSVCIWPCSQNLDFFMGNIVLEYVYIAVCVIFYIFILAGLISTLQMTKKYTPEYINGLVENREIEYSEVKPSKRKRNNP